MLKSSTVPSSTIAWLDSGGIGQWLQLLLKVDWISALAEGSSGFVYLVGNLNGPILHQIDPGAASYGSRVASAGTLTRTNDIAAANDGTLWVTGFYLDSIDLGGGELAHSGNNTFLLRVDE